MSELPDTQVHRKRDRQRFDAESLERILADGFVAHVGLIRDGHPVVLPFLYGVGDLGDGGGRQLLLHGSTGGGLLLDAREAGLAICATITHVDSLVLAVSTFDSSADYRSAAIFGTAAVVPAELKWDALRIISEHVVPGRTSEVRDMTEHEIRQTQVLRVPLDHASVKVREGGIDDAPDDGEDHAVWSGVVPLALRAGAPATSAATNASVPDSVRALVARLSS